MVFIHIPKTGGTSVEYVLGMHGGLEDVGINPYLDQAPDYRFFFGDGLQHLTAGEIVSFLNRRNSGKRIREAGFYLKFRKIIDLFRRHQIRETMKGLGNDYFIFSIVRNPYDRLVSQLAWEGGGWHREEPLGKEKFKARVREILSRRGKLRPGIFRPQNEYLLSGGELLPQKVFHFEDFNEIETELSRRLGFKANIPSRMKSLHKPWQEYYEPAIKEMVYGYYAKDFELFGYEK